MWRKSLWKKPGSGGFCRETRPVADLPLGFFFGEKMFLVLLMNRFVPEFILVSIVGDLSLVLLFELVVLANGLIGLIRLSARALEHAATANDSANSKGIRRRIGRTPRNAIAT